LQQHQQQVQQHHQQQMQQGLDHQPCLGGSVLSSQGTNGSSRTAMSTMSYGSSGAMGSNYSSGLSSGGDAAASVPMAIMGRYGSQLLQQLHPQPQPLQPYAQLGPALELRQQRRQTEATGQESMILPWQQDQGAGYLTGPAGAVGHGGDGCNLASNMAAAAAALMDRRAAFSETASDTPNVLSCSSYTERAFRDGGLEGFNRLTLALEMGLSGEDAAALGTGAKQAVAANGGGGAASVGVGVRPTQISLGELPGQRQTMLTSALLSIHESASGSGSEQGIQSLVGGSDVGGMRSVLDLQSDLNSTSSRSRAFGEYHGGSLAAGSLFPGWPALPE
jgi:hypothetical protein